MVWTVGRRSEEEPPHGERNAAAADRCTDASQDLRCYVVCHAKAPDRRRIFCCVLLALRFEALDQLGPRMGFPEK